MKIKILCPFLIVATCTISSFLLDMSGGMDIIPAQMNTDRRKSIVNILVSSTRGVLEGDSMKHYLNSAFYIVEKS